jgi:outer membrane protein TolC
MKGKSVLRSSGKFYSPLAIYALLLASLGAHAQTPNGVNAVPAQSGTSPAELAMTPSAQAASPSAVAAGLQQQLQNAQNPYLGAVPQATPTAGVIDLSLEDAIDRGLKFNLGLYETGIGGDQARAARLRSLSSLRPMLTGRVGELEQQLNLAALGLPPNSLFPTVIGPFPVFDARAYLTQTILNFQKLNDYRASKENVNAAQFSMKNARDLVVLVVGGSYISAVSAEARILAVQAEVNTAQALYNQAVDMKKAGVIADIDLLRAQVEYQSRQQSLLSAQNDFEKQKLTLARAIGIPLAQQFRLTNKMEYEQLPPLTVEGEIQRALENRSDYLSAQALLRSAELQRKAASDQRLPGVEFDGDYGLLGRAPYKEAHGTFTASVGVQMPIFDGGRIRSEIDQADATVRQRQAELGDLRAQIEQQVRTAMLDVTNAAQQVEVARSSAARAAETVHQSRDRFAAGVTNNLEVVQAQESLATANDNYINSLFAHNLAKLSLARSVGVAEQAVKVYLRRK